MAVRKILFIHRLRMMVARNLGTADALVSNKRQVISHRTEHQVRNFNTSGPRQAVIWQTTFSNTYIFLNEDIWISINISLKFVPEGPINNIPALVQIVNVLHI